MTAPLEPHRGALFTRLQVGERVHSLHGPVGVELHGHFRCHARGQSGHVDGHGCRGHAKAVLVQLHCKARHRLHCLVLKGQVDVYDTSPVGSKENISIGEQGLRFRKKR